MGEKLPFGGNYPHLSPCSYVAVCDDNVCVYMCLICEAIWKLIRSWLTAEQRNKVILVSRQEISNYVSADQLEEHMLAAPAV